LRCSLQQLRVIARGLPGFDLSAAIAGAERRRIEDHEIEALLGVTRSVLQVRHRVHPHELDARVVL
jgi:hypothetical protein